MSISKIYKALSTYNDIKAVSKGRIIQRIYNRFLCKFIGKWFK